MKSNDLISVIKALPILADFNDFLSYIQEHRVKLTGAKHIGPKDCFAMNQSMYHAEQGVHGKTRHPKYISLWLYFQVAKVGKLVTEEAKKSTTYLVIDEERLSHYQALNDIEKYFFLLQTAWVDNDLNLIMTNDRASDTLAYFYETLSTFIGNDKKTSDFYYTSLVNDVLILFDYLGFWDFEYEGDYKRFKSLTILPLGEKLLPLLMQERPILYWNEASRATQSYRYYENFLFVEEYEDFDEEEAAKELERVEKESFILPFQAIFPQELKQELKTEKVLKRGVYTFKVYLKHAKKIWRRIQLSGDFTMYSLHLAILEAYGFDNDHLYAFFLDAKMYSSAQRLDDPDRGGTGPFSTEYAIEELDFSINTKIAYVFDFGDRWEFELIVEDINADGKEMKHYVIIESKGESPEQYPDYDDF